MATNYCTTGYYTAGVTSYTDPSTTDAATACNNRRAALGYPSNWVCSGSPSQSGATCVTTSSPCCTYSSEWCKQYPPNAGLYEYYTDPCCGTSCPTTFIPYGC